MLLEPLPSIVPLTQEGLARHEAECLAFYSRCARHDLAIEVQAVLDRIVKLRKELHQMLTDRLVDGTQLAVQQLLLLEAQAAAVRRACGECQQRTPAGPENRRKERRRTARE